MGKIGAEYRQKVLADFGDFVLDHEDLDKILIEGCRLISDALKTPYAKVIQIEQERDTGLVRVGIGWNPGVVGKERISLSENTSEAYAIKTAQPVVTQDISEEKRFRFPKFLRDHGVRAIVNVPIFLPGRHPWGLLQVDDCEPRDFDSEDIEFLKVYAMVLGPVIDRLQAVGEREDARTKLLQRESRLHRILSRMDEGFALLDSGFCVTELNTEGLRMIGLPIERVHGRELWEFYPGNEQPDVKRAFKQAMCDRVAVTIEHEIFVADRSSIWVEMRAYPNDDGTLAVFWRDVTQRRASLEKLQQSEQTLKSAIEVAEIGLWDWDVPAGEVTWSDKCFELMGYSIGEVTPTYHTGMASVHPDDRQAEMAKIEKSIDTSGDYFSEFRVVQPDGSVRWLRTRGRFFQNLEGEHTRMIGAAIDITEPRELQERQRVLVAELQHRTRNLISLVRSISDKTIRGSGNIDEFRLKYHDRLDALARAQGLLSQLGPDDRVAFDKLIETEIAALNGEATAGKVSLRGPKGIRLRSSAVQTLAMALHELATNSLKYGALRQTGARLEVNWSIVPKGDDQTPWLHIDWREIGVTMPDPDGHLVKTGEGRELIEKALPYQLKARTSYELGTDGVRCTISIPLANKQ